MEAHLSVGDVALTVSAPDSFELDPPTQRFLVPPRSADLHLEVDCADLSEREVGPLRFDSGALWSLHQTGDTSLFRFASPYYGPAPYKVAILESNFSRGRILFHRPYLRPESPLRPLEYPLHELLVSSLLFRRGGIEVHASGVVAPDGRGHVLVGYSGAGKTTSARLFASRAGFRILSDDRIIIRRDENGGGYSMYGTPWHGEAEFAEPDRAPLEAIYILRHGETNQLARLGASNAAAQLFARSFLPFYSAEAIHSTLAVLDDLVTTVPCWEFSFKPDESAVEFLCARNISAASQTLRG